MVNLQVFGGPEKLIFSHSKFLGGIYTNIMSQDDRTPHDGSNPTVATPVMLCIPCAPRKKKQCIDSDCTKTPNFNIEGETTGLYCKFHKLDDMVNVVCKQCEHPNCKKQPFFNMDGETTGLYCSLHKSDDMVNIFNKRCEHANCMKQPIFNIEGEIKGRYCSLHKSDDMINVVTKRCEYPTCSKCPSFNFEGEIRAIYCKLHKKDNMINVSSKRCEHPKCTTMPTFNVEGETIGRYCKLHKQDNMFDVKHKPCQYPKCTKRPIYNFEGQPQAIFCIDHQKPTMINIFANRCLTEHCMTIANAPKYRGYCFPCFINTFPDEPVTRNYKTKERAVVESIMQHHPDVTWIHDRRIQDGCSRRRPDLLADFGEFVICIEVDENKHEGYSCENRRIMEISQDIGHRPLIILRFNPDAYVSGGVRHTSCWRLNKMGILTIPKTKTAEWNTRLTTLNDTIRTWIGTKTDKTVEIVELFYDD